MSTFLRNTTLVALLATTQGCIALGPYDPYVDTWMASWKYQEETVPGPGGEKLKDGKLVVKGKSNNDDGASFIFIPVELGVDSWADVTIETPLKNLSPTAIAGIEVRSGGFNPSAFLLTQPNEVGGQVWQNVFAQVGGTLVGQTAVQAEHVNLKVMLDANDFHFFVDNTKLGQFPIPDPSDNWFIGYGISGLAKKQRIAIRDAHVMSGIAKPGLTPRDQVKKAIFEAGEPVQELMFGNDGKLQAQPTVKSLIQSAQARLTAARAKATTDLVGKEKKMVLSDLDKAQKDLTKLTKKCNKKQSKGKVLSSNKVRKLAAAILKDLSRAVARLGKPTQ